MLSVLRSSSFARQSGIPGVRPCYKQKVAHRRMGDYAAPWEACLLPLDKQVMDGRLSQGEHFPPLTPVLPICKGAGPFLSALRYNGAAAVSAAAACLIFQL